MKEEPLMHKEARPPRPRPPRPITYSRSPSFCKTYGLWVCLFCVGIAIAIGGTILAVKLTIEEETNNIIEAITFAPITVPELPKDYFEKKYGLRSQSREPMPKFANSRDEDEVFYPKKIYTSDTESTQIEYPCGSQAEQEKTNALIDTLGWDQDGPEAKAWRKAHCPDGDINTTNAFGSQSKEPTPAPEFTESEDEDSEANSFAGKQITGDTKFITFSSYYSQ